MSTPYYIALTCCPSSEIATQLAQSCVEKKLAACVNIIPAVQSIYWWNGKVEQDNEILLVMKTTQEKLALLENFIQQQHPYDIPEFITINIESGSKKYLDWITQSLK